MDTQLRTNRISFLAWLLGAFLLLDQEARATDTATGATGLYGTGFTTSGTEIASGDTSASAAWSVTGDIANGVSASKFLGTTYVVTTSIPSADGWVAEQSTGEWITAPGATEYAGSYPNSDSSNANIGGVYLPGEGTSYASSGGGNFYQEGVYVYTLTFTIAGTGSAGQAVSNFSLNLSAAADNQFTVYVNPTESSGLPTSTAAYSSPTGYGQLNESVALAYNATSADFKQGTNTLVFVVDDTGGTSGASSDNATTASGLLVYGITDAVPEMSPWLPLAVALVAYGAMVWLRRRRPGLENYALAGSHPI